MPQSEFQRAQTVRLISDIAAELSQSGEVAKVIAQAETPLNGPVPIPNLDLLTEEASAQGLYFLLHREERPTSTWYVGLISKLEELDAEQLNRYLQ